ncbi:hypothetical protein EOD42_20425 [Rhodovarius crocodyli]|uniref:ATPase AAA-type core domain-containing protein n=1 Tax=Rhodovarius crocodyli TaxID=1979269 RepID=A0A437M2G5_9PROT|nr:AAA family ATPase [Rhodovarius crocodyli]RVT91694.1 hypothetical protein EOD42_20425 [Rhodovarius crocodyli]
MKPIAISFSRYRAFKDEVRFELKPMTVIIGRNGGGKSVLTRLPVLLGGALTSNEYNPVDLAAGGINHGNRYEDLVHLRSAQSFNIGAEGINKDGEILSFTTTMRHIVENYSLGIERFELLRSTGEKILISLTSPEDIGNPKGSYDIIFGDKKFNTESIIWHGLLPFSIPEHDDISRILQVAREQFISAFGKPSYLGPFRSETGNFGRTPRQGVRHLGPRGEGALEVLGDDALRREGLLGKAVSDWFSASLGGSATVLRTDGGVPRLLVHDASRNLDVDLQETGAGFAQVLPIVVQALAHRQKVLSSPILIVEQPELHLHPGAHGAVMDLLISRAVEAPDAPYIIETHSEQIITRLRRRVAEGILSPDLVRIYSIGHRSSAEDSEDPIRSIDLDHLGNTTSWPIGVFDEALDDIIHLRSAASKKSHQH